MNKLNEIRKLDEFINTLIMPFENNIQYHKLDIKQENIIDKCPSSYRYFFAHSNGGYTKYMIKHFYVNSKEYVHNIFHINEQKLWKKYFGLSFMDFCFSESIYGDQFFFRLDTKDGAIYRLYLETGEIVKEYDDFSDFLMLECFDITEYEPDLIDLKAIQAINGEIPTLPIHVGCIQPVLLGGSEVDPSNYEYIDPITHLIICGQIYSQFKK